MPTLLPLLLAPLALAPIPLQEMESGDMEYGAQPLELGPHAERVGEWIPDLTFTDLDQSAGQLSEVVGERGLVIALRDTDCPLSKRYAPRLAQMEEELARRGFGLLYVGVQPREDCARDVETYSLGARYAVDPDGDVARALAATTTTEVFVLDGARTVRYRGMIDDQYGLGFARQAAEHEYLREALDAVEAGVAVRAPATAAQGCLLAITEGPVPEVPVTWHERVGRILQERCVDCHRTGGVGPFPLETYEQAKRRSRMIRWVLNEGIMPPWFAEEGSGPWRNDASLTPHETADVLAWIAADMPEGDPANAALPLEYVEGWTIGEPDLVVSMPEPFEVPAEGVIDYQYFDVQLDTTEDRWVQEVEIRPGARQVVHHVIIWADEPDAPRRRNGAESFFAATAPGAPGIVFPVGFAKRLPAGARISFQMHYTANGTPATDRTEVGFVFADEPPLAEVVTASAYDDGFAIPPGAFDYAVSAEYAFPSDAAILTLFPHTHLRGVRFLYELEYPDGRREDLLPVPEYDFNWQLYYDLQTPLQVPSGTRLIATGWYDNTPDNPANPDPTATVRFGEQTFDEMMIGYVNWVPVGARPVEASAPRER
jgi:mono/diheme cytochrome c family protein